MGLPWEPWGKRGSGLTAPEDTTGAHRKQMHGATNGGPGTIWGSGLPPLVSSIEPFERATPEAAAASHRYPEATCWRSTWEQRSKCPARSARKVSEGRNEVTRPLSAQWSREAGLRVPVRDWETEPQPETSESRRGCDPTPSATTEP